MTKARPHAPPSESLSQEELARYSRHLVIPQVGAAGQRRLKGASALIIGLGGLGAPLAQYLAAAGVGRIGLVDPDVVELSNLHRQVLYTVADVGRAKVEAARERLLAQNPGVKVEAQRLKLSSENALKLIGSYDVVVDATDNFPARYLINDACVLAGKPDVYASVFRFEGQVSVFWADRGPCYRCLFPKPPPPGAVPSCEDAGVLGVLPGIVGSLQAAEALKLLLGVGESLIGRLLVVDALDANVTSIAFRKNPTCPVCGTKPTVTKLMDYEAFCGLAPNASAPARDSMDVVELKQRLDRRDGVVLVDCREPFEYEIAHIGGSLLIPMREVERRLGELDPSREIVVHCHTGARSNTVARFLRSRGFPRVYNLTGGIRAWSRQVDSSVPDY